MLACVSPLIPSASKQSQDLMSKLISVSNWGSYEQNTSEKKPTQKCLALRHLGNSSGNITKLWRLPQQNWPEIKENWEGIKIKGKLKMVSKMQDHNIDLYSSLQLQNGMPN